VVSFAMSGSDLWFRVSYALCEDVRFRGQSAVRSRPKSDSKMGRSPARVGYDRGRIPRSHKFKHDHVCAISGAERSKT
jgi:hypothetical protein